MLSLLRDHEISLRWLAAEAGKLVLLWILTAAMVVMFWGCYLVVTGQIGPGATGRHADAGTRGRGELR